MTLKQQLIAEIESTHDQKILQQLFEFLQTTKEVELPKPNSHLLLKLAGCITDEEAEQMKALINSEFSHIEGKW
jgi:hypothetical protein